MSSIQTTTAGNSKGLETVQNQYKQTAKGKADPLGKDAFLKMLMAQLQHQDPLNPMQGADFSAQLAQFSSLEQLFNVNSNLKTLTDSISGNSEKDLLNYIGKEVESNNDTIDLKEGKGNGGYFTIDKPADVSVSIFNSTGNEIKRLFIGHQDAGTHQILWNGTDNSDNSVADGNYSFEVQAVGDGGAYVASKNTVSGKITGVTYEDGKSYLLMGDKLIDPAKVVKVWQVEENTADSKNES